MGRMAAGRGRNEQFQGGLGFGYSGPRCFDFPRIQGGYDVCRHCKLARLPMPSTILRRFARPITTRFPSTTWLPCWEVLRKRRYARNPRPKCKAAIWKFSDVQKLMGGAGDVIAAEEAERRVLVLEKPSRARPDPHHQFLVRRHPAHHAGRSCAGPSARRFRDPLCARRRRRLHRAVKARRRTCRRAISS